MNSCIIEAFQLEEKKCKEKDDFIKIGTDLFLESSRGETKFFEMRFFFVFSVKFLQNSQMLQ